MPIEVVSLDMNLTRDAARFKAAGGRSDVDCFSAALALREDVPLLTGDRQFEMVEGEVEIEWL